MIRFGLDGRVVMVTGGGSGIGRATALALASEGARVVVADMRQEGAAQVADEIAAAGGTAVAAAFDVRDREATRRAVASAADAYGSPVEGLVCSAGTSRAAPAEELDLAQWDLVLDSNVKGSFLSAQAVARGLIAAGRGGSIVLISSLNGRGGHPGRAHYAPPRPPWTAWRGTWPASGGATASASTLSRPT